MKEKILITGCAGFIGFHLTKLLLKENYNVFGIDNLNFYYDQKLKIARLNILKKYSNFNFNKTNITNLKSCKKIFNLFQPHKVVHLAAQSNLRYSIINPFIYLKSNLNGFVNILELCNNNNVKGLIYASSSTVYGANKKTPFAINDTTEKQTSFYGVTKKSNELMAFYYSNMYNLNVTGLRFFTVYGPWGRPDMAYYGFTEKIIKNKEITVFNNGKMQRDFTYIDDIVDGIKMAIIKNYKCKIFNLGSNKSENILKLVDIIEEKLGKKALIKFSPIQPGEVKTTYADIKESIKMLNYKPKININSGVPKFINWYLKYNKINLNEK